MSLSQKKIIDSQKNNIIQEKNVFKLIDQLKTTIESLKLIISKNEDLEINNTIKNYFNQINNIIELIINIINSYNSQNESIQRKDEQSLRILYGKLFNQKLVNEILENKIAVLYKKEKEYELLKQKTGAIICNGQIICNERKDNEIIILRTENSLLKEAIKTNEDLLKEKNDIINNLNNDIILYKRKIKELHKIKHGKFSSFSNINININETKKENSQNNIKSNKNNFYMNSLQVNSLNKNNNKENNKNNIYSSYKNNSKMINRVNNTKKKSKINKEKNNQNYNNKNIKIDYFNNKEYSFKYISVNKSLFSPKNNYKKPKMKLNNENDKKTLQINRIKKNKYILHKNLINREFSTITYEPHCSINEEKIKKIIINNRLIIKHRKANSIQYPDISIKRLIKAKKEKNLSLDSDKNRHIYSGLRKFSKMKNQSFKINNKSLPSSILNTISEGFRRNNQAYSQKCLTYFLKAYADRNSDNRGRNDNNYIKENFYNKENSLCFLHKSLMNRTSCENNNCFNKIKL